MKKNTLYTANPYNMALFEPRKEKEESNVFLAGGAVHKEPKKHRDELREVNRYNKAAFMPKTEKKENLFFGGGMADSDYTSYLDKLYAAQQGFMPNKTNERATYKDPFNSDAAAQNVSFLNKIEFKPDVAANAAISKPAAVEIPKAGATSFANTKLPDISKTPNIAKQPTGTASTSGSAMGSIAKAGLGAMAGMGSQIGVSETNKRGLFDALDPVHALAGGRESAVGNVMGDTGVGLFQAGASTGQPYLMLAGAALKVVGGLTNAAFGIKADKEKLNRANASIDSNKNFISNAGSFDQIKGPRAMSNTDVYEGGWFSGGAADDKNEELAQRMTDAYSWAERSAANNAANLTSDQINDFLRNYSAFGGYLTRPKRKRRIRK